MEVGEVTSSTKKCSRCDEYRAIDSFAINSKSKGTFRSICKVCDRIRKIKHYENNRETILKQQAEYYKDNKESIKLKKASSYTRRPRKSARNKISSIIGIIRCTSCDTEKSRESFYSYNLCRCKSCISDYQKQYNSDNKNKRSEYGKIFYDKNKECILKKSSEYYLNNRARHRELCRKRSLMRRHSDINYKLTKQLRNRLNTAIKNNQKYGSAIRDLGCTIDELKTHLESLFQPGMAWDNWSKDGWHIDHIVPLCSFDLSNIDQFKKACHYTNLQPLWAKENLIKGAHLSPELKAKLEAEANKSKDKKP